MTTALSFEDVSKTYRGAQEYRALRDDIAAALGPLVGRARPKRRSVHALDHVSLEIPEGQSFALIGENGAGKSTALKIASRIAYPTSGQMLVRGRVGALIEVGTGMHPELTGRENIYLYGAILGLSRRAIERRFDEIVDFAGIGAAIDQPVKQYSSGMQLRVGFSVAAHLEPDLLLVDEAIAVGDAGFQFRCVDRMAALVREGRTLVFVSHDMSAVEALCTRAVWLANGCIAADGTARDVVHEYLLDVQRRRVEASEDIGTDGSSEDFAITGVELLGAAGSERTEFSPGEPLTVRVRYRTSRPIESPSFSVGLSDGGMNCFTMASMLQDGQSPARLNGEGTVDCTFRSLSLNPKAYEVWLSVRGSHGYGDLFTWQRVRLFRVIDALGEGQLAATASMTYAPVRMTYDWSIG
jgi:ABC-type polysaccharide/polyol phosphate transport system ATPase subunit